MQVVFYGGSKYVLPIIEAIHPVLIITTEKFPTDPVINYALKNRLPYLSVTNLNNDEVKNKLKESVTELAILADFGLIVPIDILNLYPKGIINIHPSLLPKYRGPTPVQSAILNNDLTTGVTLIKLDSDIDHGPVIAQTKASLNVDDTAESAYLKLFKEGASLLMDSLEKYLTGDIIPMKQDHNKATFTKILTRQSGFFHIENPPPSDHLKRMINAYYPWPGAWTKVHLRGVSSLTPQENQLKILKFLPEEKLQVEGKSPINIQDFCNGYPELKEMIRKIMKYDL